MVEGQTFNKDSISATFAIPVARGGRESFPQRQQSSGKNPQSEQCDQIE